MSHPKSRAERRETTLSKWKSRLKKLWESNFFFERVRNVKSDNSLEYSDLPKAESYKDFEKDRFGVLLKNTGTLYSDKEMSIQDERKRNLENRKVKFEEEIIFNEETGELIIPRTTMPGPFEYDFSEEASQTLKENREEFLKILEECVDEYGEKFFTKEFIEKLKNNDN